MAIFPDMRGSLGSFIRTVSCQGGRKGGFGSCLRLFCSLAPVAHQYIHGRHAHCHTHLNLFLYDAAVQIVGDFPVDFNAAVHWAWVHNNGIWLGVAQFLSIQTIAVILLARGMLLTTSLIRRV